MAVIKFFNGYAVAGFEAVLLDSLGTAEGYGEAEAPGLRAIYNAFRSAREAAGADDLPTDVEIPDQYVLEAHKVHMDALAMHPDVATRDEAQDMRNANQRGDEVLEAVYPGDVEIAWSPTRLHEPGDPAPSEAEPMALVDALKLALAHLRPHAHNANFPETHAYNRIVDLIAERELAERAGPPDLRTALADLLEWETNTGGWDNPAWMRARVTMDRQRDLEDAQRAAGVPVPEPAPAVPSAAETRLVDVLSKVLGCSELNMDDMEPETQEVIEEATDLLADVYER